MTDAAAVSKEMSSLHALLEESMQYWNVRARTTLVSKDHQPAIQLHGDSISDIVITQVTSRDAARWHVERKPAPNSAASSGGRYCPSILSLLRTVRHMLDLPEPAYRVRMGVSSSRQ